MDPSGTTTVGGFPQTALRHPGHRDEAATMVLLEGVSRRYDLGGVSVTALADIDLEVDEGSSPWCSDRPVAVRPPCST